MWLPQGEHAVVGSDITGWGLEGPVDEGLRQAHWLWPSADTFVPEFLRVRH